MSAAPPQTLEEFDRLVQEFYHNSSGGSQKERDTQLNQFSKNPGSIAHVQDILQTEATQPETKCKSGGRDNRVAVQWFPRLSANSVTNPPQSLLSRCSKTSSTPDGTPSAKTVALVRQLRRRRWE